MFPVVLIRAVKNRIGIRLRAASFGFVSLLFASGTNAQTTDGQSQPFQLSLDQSVQRPLAGGQKYFFDVACTSGQYVSLSVGQRGIDVAVRLLDSDGKVIVEYDYDPRIVGDEDVEFVSDQAGNCRLTVEPRQRAARPGNFLITWKGSRESMEKEKSLYESRLLMAQATRLWRSYKYTEALPLAEKAVAIRERELGLENPDVGFAIFTLANIYSDLPDLKKAEANYLRAIEIRAKTLGADHFSLAGIYNNFGFVYKEQGHYAKAEALYQKALDIRERVLEPDHLLIASAMNNLANVARLLGNDSKAAQFYRKVLEIREKALGPEDPEVATSLNNLANNFSDLATAEPLYLRALAIREKKLPPDSPDIGQTLYNLAVLYMAAGDVAKADAACTRALAIAERALGAEHPFTTYPLNLSASIAKSKGDFDKAEQLFERTISIKEKVQGTRHPDLGGSYTNLANLFAIKGEAEKAIRAQTRANEIFDYNITLNLATGSERDKANYIRTLSYIGDQSVSLNFDLPVRSAAAAELALTSVLQRKGRVLDAMSENMKSLRNRLDPRDQVLIDELAETTSKLSQFVLNGPQEMSGADYQKRLTEFESKRDSLERRINRQSDGFFEGGISSPLDSIRKAIGPNAALIEFTVYRPIARKMFELSVDDRARPTAFGEPHYAAFVTRATGEIIARDLGETKVIDLAINEFRRALRTPAGADWKRAARTLEQVVMKPIAGSLRGVTQLLLSPDGQLNLIPFEALMNENGGFLVEEYSISYLTSGRDLIRKPNSTSSVGKTLIIADPAFGEPTSNPEAASRTRGKAVRRSITATRSLSDTYFAPLGGTAREALSIRSIFPESVSFTGAQATETLLKKTVAPRILHLATHGFFLEADDPQNGKATKAQSGSQIENPLLRSGLAFMGANRRGSDGEDGILTALEASGLNLWGTKLVVLSACDTGVGDVRNGEGVYGLRRSFRIAGAETLVMSLWPVSDYVTRELMTGYYTNLKQGIGRGESLRRIQLEMLKRPARRHPFYWASFIQSGEWANLDGKR